MRIYQLSDCHLQLDNNAPGANLIQALALIEAKGDGQLLLLTGDLVCGPSIALYESFKRLIETHTSIANIYAIAGNHDDLVMMKQVFRGSRIQIKEHVHLNDDLSLCFVDSSQKPRQAMTLGAGRVSNRSLSQLRKFTRKHQSIVVIHHPVLNLGAKWFTEIGIENHFAVADAINSQTLAVVSGHAHAFFKVPLPALKHTSNDTTVPLFVSPATSYGFNHDKPDYEKSPNIGIMAYDIEREFIVNGSVRLSPRYQFNESVIDLTPVEIQ
ncbi:metallophosphoesterase [Shewanella sp. UCD-KL12]|uniref:metallophosphoesterase family protein n=1 Tax=Shewanella sp. UCD-KL12 TaxID=1917163 RepID=UPI0009709FBD|nr:metallophosphoesterase [Shewanella sp. UCD-KL12]